jgi:hypothetical protein
MNQTGVFTALDVSGEIWNSLMSAMLDKSRHIIALRGAGSYNGISIGDSNRLLANHLIPRLQNYLNDGHVSVIYDGDDDVPAFPDIGHIMGRLRDYFGSSADWYAVQKQGWYRYAQTLPTIRPLHSAQGNEYCTVIFPDGAFPGEHDHFSQNMRLAASTHYEQWYVGACGQIAEKQLADYSTKAGLSKGTHRALIFKAPVSIEQEQELHRKLATGGDPASVKRWNDALDRRAKNPYGLICTPEGEFISLPAYSNLTIEVF